jgi:hypothetical protein
MCNMADVQACKWYQVTVVHRSMGAGGGEIGMKSLRNRVYLLDLIFYTKSHFLILVGGELQPHLSRLNHLDLSEDD